MKKAISLLLGPIHRASCCEQWIKSTRIHLGEHCTLGFLIFVQLDLRAVSSKISEHCSLGFLIFVQLDLRAVSRKISEHCSLGFVHTTHLDFRTAKALCELCMSLKEAVCLVAGIVCMSLQEADQQELWTTVSIGAPPPLLLFLGISFVRKYKHLINSYSFR